MLLIVFQIPPGIAIRVMAYNATFAFLLDGEGAILSLYLTVFAIRHEQSTRFISCDSCLVCFQFVLSGLVRISSY